MRKAVHVAIACCLLLCVAQVGLAQNTNSSDIRGTVTDPSGAVLPGVNVTVTNVDTGVVRDFVTNSDGLYDTNSILPGSYTITFSKDGFQKLVVGPITLQIGLVTVNGDLKVGSSNQVIEVKSDAPILKTEDAQVATSLSTQQLTDLPSVDPANGWTSLLKLLPGATSTPGGTNGGGQNDLSNPGIDQAVAGSMPYFSSYLVDGGSIWLPHSANIDQGQSESVSEVNVIASTASAQYGGGGTVFNVISKSGTNQFHGSLYDYFQNDAMNARDYFNRTGAKGKQRFNYFGGAIGGPILKDKLFFYFNYQQLENPNSQITRVSVPTADMKAGCFDPAIFGTNLTLDAAHGGTSLTPNPAQCGAFNPADLALPTADFDPVAVNIQKNFLAPNLSGIGNNFSFLKAGSGNSKKFFGRLDYNISAKNRINITTTMHDNPHKTNIDPGPNCPIACENNAGEGYNAQITDVYTINSTMVNEFRYSFVRQGNWFVPQTLKKGFPAQLGLQFSNADVFPTVNFNGTGAPSNNELSPGTNAVFIENTFIPSDVLTLVHGKHILHFGGEVMFEQDNSTPWGSIHGADFTFTGQFTTNDPTKNVGYADFLLGDAQQWSTSTQPEHGMRAKNFSFFAQDDIKLRPNLTVNLGVRSETHGGMSEVQNNLGGFDPTVINPVTNTLGTVSFAGENGAHTQSFKTKTKVMPRLGLAWQPTNNWVVRGGVGQYSALWSMDTVGGPLGFGTGVTGTASANPGQAPVVQLSGTGAGLPIIAGRDPATYITPANPQGNGFIPFTPYDLPIMNGWQWTGSVQRRLPANMVVEAQYVGSHWDNLHFEADINQVPADKLGGGQLARPFPQFSSIGIGSGGSRTGLYTGVSNYHAVNVLLKKPFGFGLSADVAYTWSRLKDDMDTSGWGNQFGAVYYQDAFNPHANYALSNFDRPNSLKGSLTYAIPLGRGHQYLNSAVADAAVGGWQVSSIIIAQSGSPFTVVMNSATPSGALCNGCALYPNLVGNPSAGQQSLNQWFNQLAFAPPPANTFGNNQRNSLRGPDLTDVDLSLAKTWGIPGWERGKLQLRMDAVNILNHPSFRNPSNNLNPNALTSGVPDPSVGQISATTITGRTLQLSARFSF
jgi:Carboxypeptidase regulatory-like domain/TonB dependent receptor